LSWSFTSNMRAYIKKIITSPHIQMNCLIYFRCRQGLSEGDQTVNFCFFSLPAERISLRYSSLLWILNLLRRWQSFRPHCFGASRWYKSYHDTTLHQVFNECLVVWYSVRETERVRQRERPYIHYTCMHTYNHVCTKYASGNPLSLFTHSHAHANWNSLSLPPSLLLSLPPSECAGKGSSRGRNRAAAANAACWQEPSLLLRRRMQLYETRTTRDPL
jgi:hypothetical protein